MRVLHLSFQANTGGAARSTYQLHRALINAGIDSRLLVREKDVDDDTVDAVPRRATTWIESLPARVRQKLDRMQIPAGAEFTTDRATMASTELEGVEDFDVIHLHYINYAFDEPLLFHRLKKTQRLVWTLHDAYPFTGGCHIVRDCERYATGCGRCPRLGGARDDDLSARIIRRKLERLRGFDVTFIGQSRWVVACSERSVIGKEVRHYVIPESIDTSQFLPTDRNAAKETLGVPVDRIVVGWFAAAVDDPNKGLDLLQEAMRGLDPNRFHVLWAGNGDFDFEVPCTHTRLQPLRGRAAINEFYAACDIVAVTSRQETFCLVACEAASCGTPVVAYAATGLLDALTHGENGFLVEPYSVDALRDEIARIAALPLPEYAALRAQVRTASVAKYDLELLAQRHVDVYEGNEPR